MSNTEVGSPAQGIRVVIVDDHAIFRSGLKADLDPDIVVEQLIALVDHPD